MDKAPSFAEKPQISRSGRDIEFTCSLVGRPLPSIEWSMNGQPLGANKSEPRIRVAEHALGDDVYRLTLKLSDPCEDDSGNYSVTARNALGTATANISLNLR